MRVRALSYNVRGLRDDRLSLYRTILSAQPDIVLFQEIPRLWRRRSRLKLMEQATGLRRVAGGTLFSYGVMIAATSEVRVFESGVLRLPHTLGQQRRAVAWAHVEHEGRKFTLISVHLGHTESERKHHIRYAMTHLQRKYKVVLGGDFNEEADGPVWEYLRLGLMDRGEAENQPTFSTRNPRKRLDGILTDPLLRVINYRVLAPVGVSYASDHFPVCAEVLAKRAGDHPTRQR